MGMQGNGVNHPGGNGIPFRAPGPVPADARCPRRLVLLADGEESTVRDVLAEFRGADVSGRRLHAELQRLAGEHPGQFVAAEWRGKLGWTRFLWCRAETGS